MTSAPGQANPGTEAAIGSVFLQPEPEQSVFDFKSVADRAGYKPATDWTIEEAFLCLILSAAAADGFVPAEEHVEIRALARRSRVLKVLNPAQLAHANAVVAERLRQRPEGLREACDALPADMRPTVFAHCADVLLADGSLSSTEATFLGQVARLLGLPEDISRRLFEVILVKNRY